MKTKIEKGLKYLAAGLFFIALVLNVKITLEDPFIMLSEAVVAQTTSTSSSSSSNSSSYPHYGNYGRDLFNCSYTATATADGTVSYKGITIPVKANIEFTISCTNCAWDCNANGANATCDPESC